MGRQIFRQGVHDQWFRMALDGGPGKVRIECPYRQQPAFGILRLQEGFPPTGWQ
jgi:hypothetical protein